MFFVGVLFIPSNPEFVNPNNVPSMVSGIATMAGTLTAFIGFMLPYILEKIEATTPRKWISMRLAILFITISLGLVFVLLGLQELVYGSYVGAYNGAVFGIFMIILVLFEVMFMVVISQFEPNANLAEPL